MISHLKTISLMCKRFSFNSLQWQACLHEGVENANKGPVFFITTPIFYVNGAPHIGHLYTALLADASARWKRLNGQKVFFTAGTDEHGLKIQQAADRCNSSTSDFCDSMSQKFRSLFDECGITYDDFVRTTEARHCEAVQAFWEQLYNSGHVYKGVYKGWYSTADEAFLSDDEVHEETVCSERRKVSKFSGHQVVWTMEENYIFRLSCFREPLLAWLDTQPIKPVQFESFARGWLNNLCDISISRPKSRLSWGISVPGDESQIIYVWLDALINYLTVTGYHYDHSSFVWPPSVHIIGKDILRFHVVYWPAFLMAVGLSPSTSIVCHSHWLVGGRKMSKSLGNIVDPVECTKNLTADGLRYFLLKEGSLGSDGSYCHVRAVDRINSDLANTIGNLLNRITVPSINKQQKYPAVCSQVELASWLHSDDTRMLQSMFSMTEQVNTYYENFLFQNVIDTVLMYMYWANALVQRHEPWTLANKEDKVSRQHINAVLYVAMECLRVCGILLQPIVPVLSDRLLTRLGISKLNRTVADISEWKNNGFTSLGIKENLINRIKAKT